METQGMTREVCTAAELIDFLSYTGWERIQRVVITDFREVVKIDKDGKETKICPDF